MVQPVVGPFPQTITYGQTENGKGVQVALLGPVRESVLLDPSLLVSRAKLSKIQREPDLLGSDVPHYFVPSGFVRMLTQLRGDAVNSPCWRFFAGGVAAPRPSEILTLVERLQTSVFQVPSERPQRLSNFNPARGLSPTYRRDEYLVSILDEEASFLATHSMMLSRIKAPITALVKGGLAAIEGLEGYLSREVVERLRMYGW